MLSFFPVPVLDLFDLFEPELGLDLLALLLKPLPLPLLPRPPPPFLSNLFGLYRDS